MRRSLNHKPYHLWFAYQTSTTTTDLAIYNAAKSIWNKKNAQALGLMQTTVSPVIWQNYTQYGVASDLLDMLQAKFGKAWGALTYLQLINMVKIQITNSMELLPQIQQFQDNYNWITSNGHSRLSKDLATFIFCSSLPESYEQTTWQYIDNITVIANYKLLDIIAWVLQEESRRRLNYLDKAHPSTCSPLWRTLGKSMVKQTTPLKTTGPEENVHTRARGKNPKKSWVHQETRKRQTKKERVKKRHQQVPMY